MARVRVDCAEGNAERAIGVRRESARDGRAVRDGVALEVGIVDPDGVEAGVSGASRPVDDVGNVAPGGNAQTDSTCQRSHVSPVLRCAGLPMSQAARPETLDMLATRRY